jgi:hypothetical protein
LFDFHPTFNSVLVEVLITLVISLTIAHANYLGVHKKSLSLVNMLSVTRIAAVSDVTRLSLLVKGLNICRLDPPHAIMQRGTSRPVF